MGVRSQTEQEYRVCIEPRNRYSRGHQIIFFIIGERKPTALNGRKAADLRFVMAGNQVTTGV